MKFLCEQCKTKYQISDEKIAGKTVRMKCRKCGFNIEVSADVTESSVAQKLGGPPAPKAPLRSSLTTGLSSPLRPPVKQSSLSGAFKDAVRDEASSALEILQVSSSADWYAAINGVPVGPIRMGELRQKAAQGLVTEDTLVWQEGLEEWRPVRAMPELAKLVRDAKQRGSLAPAAPRLSKPPPPPPRRSMAPRAPSGIRTPPPPAAAEIMAGAEVDIDALFSPALSSPPLGMTPAPSGVANGLTRSDPFAMGTPSPAQVSATPVPNGFLTNGAAASDPFASPMRHATPTPMAAVAIPTGDAFRTSTPPPAGVFQGMEAASQAQGGRTSPPWLIIAMLLAALAFGGVAAYAIFFRQPQSVVVQMIAPPTTAAATGATTTPTDPTGPIDTAPVASASSGPDRPGGRNTGSKTGSTAAVTTGKTVDPNIAGLLGGSGPDVKGPNGPSGGSGSSLTQNQIQSVLANRQVGLRRQCWDRMSNTPNSVRVNATVNVSGSGQVTGITTDGNDPAVAKCIEGQVRTWSFPPTGAPSTFNVPFTFLRQ